MREVQPIIQSKTTKLKNITKEEFFRILHGDSWRGCVRFCAISPDGGSPINTACKAFSEFEENLEKHSHRKNIYFTPSKLQRGCKNWKKENFLSSKVFWADLDDIDFSGETPDERRLQLLATLDRFPLVPTLTVITGGGIQAYWVVDSEITDPKCIEEINYGVAKHLGADQCHDVVRLLRCPETTNFPNEKKRRHGRKVIGVSSSTFSGCIYKLKDLEVFRQEIPGQDNIFNFDEAEEVAAPEKLQSLIKENEWLMRRFEGLDFTEKEGGGIDRSANDYAVAMELKAQGFTTKEVGTSIFQLPETKATERGWNYVNRLLERVFSSNADKRDLNKKVHEVKVSFSNNNTLYETVCENLRTHYVFLDGGNLLTADKIDLGAIEFVPPSFVSIQSKGGAVVLPSGPIEYESKAKLKDDIRQHLSRYVSLPENYLTICVLYVFLTWCFDRFSVLPYLRAVGEPGKGKSRLLQTLKSICYLPISTAGCVGVAPLFRMIDKYPGTLIMDEADFRFSEVGDDINQLLCSGYQEGVPVLRCEGQEHEPRAFRVFGPKILGGRYDYKDEALNSRIIKLEMDNTFVPGLVPINIGAGELLKQGEGIRNKLLMWRLKNYHSLAGLNFEPNGLSPRISQILNPLFSLADEDGERETLLSFGRATEGEVKSQKGESVNAEVLRGILIASKKVKSEEEEKQRVYYEAIKTHLYEALDYVDQPSGQKLSWIIRKVLKLDTTRAGGMSFIPLNERNLTRLEYLQESWGIVDLKELDPVMAYKNMPAVGGKVGAAMQTCKHASSGDTAGGEDSRAL